MSLFLINSVSTLRRVRTGPCSEPPGCHRQGPARLGPPSPPWLRRLMAHLFPPSAHCQSPDKRTQRRRERRTFGKDKVVAQHKKTNWDDICLPCGISVWLVFHTININQHCPKCFFLWQLPIYTTYEWINKLTRNTGPVQLNECKQSSLFVSQLNSQTGSKYWLSN